MKIFIEPLYSQIYCLKQSEIQALLFSKCMRLINHYKAGSRHLLKCGFSHIFRNPIQLKLFETDSRIKQSLTALAILFHSYHKNDNLKTSSNTLSQFIIFITGTIPGRYRFLSSLINEMANQLSDTFGLALGPAESFQDQLSATQRGTPFDF